MTNKKIIMYGEYTEKTLVSKVFGSGYKESAKEIYKFLEGNLSTSTFNNLSDLFSGVKE